MQSEFCFLFFFKPLLPNLKNETNYKYKEGQRALYKKFGVCWFTILLSKKLFQFYIFFIIGHATGVFLSFTPKK